nr:helix-turn-helix domain-containing protein [Streptomyces sp. HNM0574]
MAADPALAEVLTTLHVLCFSGTVRATARELHLHHNSVRHQIAKAETLLGFRVTEPMGQHRLLLSLALRRLRDVATGE